MLIDQKLSVNSGKSMLFDEGLKGRQIIRLGQLRIQLSQVSLLCLKRFFRRGGLLDGLLAGHRAIGSRKFGGSGDPLHAHLVTVSWDRFEVFVGGIDVLINEITSS